MFICCLFNNPTVPSVVAVSGLVVVLWLTLFGASVGALKRDPKRPLKLLQIGFVSLLVCAVPLLLYLIVTMFVLTDFK
jgi:hypothetical protein